MRANLADVNPKRRLPLLSGPKDSSTDGPPRPRWQWVAFGAAAIFAAWLPLCAFAGAIAARLAGAAGAGEPAHVVRVAITIGVAYAIALALGALAGGFLVGRWGTAAVGIREATLAGLTASLLAVVVSWASFGLVPGTLLAIAVAGPLAALGGKLGVNRRVQ